MRWLPPCKEHIFGTDKMGRDIFTRIIYGARASLSATFGVVALIFVLGSVLGVISGYFGGVVDAVIMRIADMMLAFPGLVLALAVAGIMGASIKNAIIAIVVVKLDKVCTSGAKPGNEDPRPRLRRSSDRHRLQNTVHAASLHASECTSDADHHSCHRCGFHDAGAALRCPSLDLEQSRLHRNGATC